MKHLNDWFRYNLIMVKGDYLNLIWLYVVYFLVVEIFVFTIEKLIGVPNVTMWYDLVLLMIAMIMLGLNSHKLFMLLIEKGN